MEVGVISNKHFIPDLTISDNGVTGTAKCGARAVYGSELGTDQQWYTAFNEDGRRRCYKDLVDYHRIGWTSKDKITIALDLDRFRIKFYHNSYQVRKVLSLQSGRHYYPFISFESNNIPSQFNVY